MVDGYNIRLKKDGAVFCAITQDDLSISATTKESITKDDEGNKHYRVVSHETTFSCSGMIEVGTSTSTMLYRDDIIALSLLKGDDAIFDITYTCEGGKTYGGKAIITGYSESSNADDEATYSLNLQITGEFAEVSDES